MQEKPIYMVMTPSISAGMKKIYQKNIEVYQCEIHEIDSYGYGARPFLRLYKINGKLKEKSVCTSFERFDEITEIGIPSKDELNSYKSFYYFYDLELAFATKIVMLNDLSEQYKEKIRELQEQHKRNMPDIAQYVQDVKDKYPEAFL